MIRLSISAGLLVLIAVAGCNKPAGSNTVNADPKGGSNSAESAKTPAGGAAAQGSGKLAASAETSNSAETKTAAADKTQEAAASKQDASPAPADYSNERPVTYRVKQVVHLDDIKPESKNIRMWVAIPDDENNQRVLDFNVVSAPGDWSIVQDAAHRCRFLKLDVKDPKDAALDVEVEFVVTRQPVYTPIDPAKVAPLSPALQQAFAADLAVDSPHMEVTDKVIGIADEVCGKETNLAKQATALMEYVEKVSDHYSYSKDPQMPKCGIGDAATCLAQGGGCCTDLHSLFIALARSRGIPARLSMGYRLQEKNLGKTVDPGYRCWVEYFIPNYGWISADIVEADTPTGLGPARWASGLTARRVWLNQGREFILADDQAVKRVNHMSIAYAEIDGVPARLLPEGELKPQITRQVTFTELPPATVNPVAAAAN